MQAAPQAYSGEPIRLQKVLKQGLRTADIMQDGGKLVSCSEMGSAVVAAL